MPDFEFIFGGVENFAGLFEVRLSVGFDLVGCQHRPGDVLACRVADSGSVIADYKDSLMAEVLELAHLSQDDGVAEMDVGAGRVEAELYAQGAVLLCRQGQLFGEVLLVEDFYRASFEQFQLTLRILGHFSSSSIDVLMAKIIRQKKVFGNDTGQLPDTPPETMNFIVSAGSSCSGVTLFFPNMSNWPAKLYDWGI